MVKRKVGNKRKVGRGLYHKEVGKVQIDKISSQQAKFYPQG